MNAITRRARHATRPRAWRALAQQLTWETRGLLDRDSSVELTWKIPESIVNELLVLWPKRYSWPNAGAWVDPIRRGIAHQARVVSADVPQAEGNIAHLVVRLGDRSVRVGIDYDDLSDLHESVEDLDVYFKMQYRRGGYEYTNVVPGGYVSRMPGFYRHASRWRALGGRQMEKYDVFARFGLLEPGAALRRAMLERMQSQRSFMFHGGTARTTSLEHLQDVCQSKVCLDAPGRGELCGRLVECLGVGACVVGPTLNNELHVPLDSGVQEVRVARDLDHFVEACQALLEDAERRRQVGTAASDYFDRYLRLEQLGGYYLDVCLKMIRPDAPVDTSGRHELTARS